MICLWLLYIWYIYLLPLCPHHSKTPPPLIGMELELSLGDSPAPVNATITPAQAPTRTGKVEDHKLVLGLRVTANERVEEDNQRTSTPRAETVYGEDDEACHQTASPMEASLSCLLPLVCAQTDSEVCRRGLDVNTVPVDDGASTPQSLLPSSMEVEVAVRQAVDQEASEDEDNGGGRVRKKLRLSKEQSASLEDSFKEHSTLTLEQKSNLANRLSLRPRQVEVWFQNRRARTKMKQTEVDCEYLKRCCETLTRENRRLQREVAELRTFRPTPTYPFYHHHHHLSGVSTALPACHSCDNNNKATIYYAPPVVATPASITTVSSPGQRSPPSSTASSLFARPHFAPFTIHPVLRRQPSAS